MKELVHLLLASKRVNDPSKVNSDFLDILEPDEFSYEWRRTTVPLQMIDRNIFLDSGRLDFVQRIAPQQREPIILLAQPSGRMKMLDGGHRIEAMTRAGGVQIDALVGIPPELRNLANPNFVRWFGESKVIDAQGNPLVVYHGTDAADIREFSGGDYPGWFATSPEMASRYANERRSGQKRGTPNVIPAFLSIKKPVSIDVDMNDQAMALKGFAIRLGLTWQYDWDQDYSRVFHVVKDFYFRKAIQQAGFDGIRANERGELTYAPILPEQIKSAIGNSGRFDPDNPSLIDHDSEYETEEQAPRERMRA